MRSAPSRVERSEYPARVTAGARHSFGLLLSHDADELVEFEVVAGKLTRYSVVLRYLEPAGRPRSVCLFDNADAQDEHHFHRYSLDGVKGPAEIAHHGEPYEAMQAARSRIETEFNEMIARWRQ